MGKIKKKKKKKHTSCFVPYAFTTEQQQWVPHAKDLLEMIENNPGFVDSIITGDESWCFTQDPPTKRQSAAWIGQESLYEKFHFQKSKTKTMFILFFDSKGVVYKKFDPERQMVTKEFYLEVLGHFLKQIAHVRPEAWENHSFNLFHKNAPAQSTLQQLCSNFWPKWEFQCLATLVSFTLATKHSDWWK